jgi:hypothetical protein
MKQFIEKTKTFVKPVSNWVLFTAAIIVSFSMGYYYPSFKRLIEPKEAPKKFVQPLTLESCSVSVTDRGEMLIINRTNGEFDVYDESVGIAVFKAYGNYVTSNQPK